MLLGLALACRQGDGAVYDGPIVEARLEKVSLHGLAILGGSFGGKADLVVVPRDGRELTVPVSLRGATFGLGIELVAWEGGAFGVPFQLPDDRVTGDDLVGRYRGSGTSLAIAAGLEARHLRNDRGVEIDAAFVPVGVAVMVGAEWLTIDPREVVLPGETGDTGSP